MGTRKSERPLLCVATTDLPSSPGHPFYTKLSAILDAEGFDRFAKMRSAIPCPDHGAPEFGTATLFSDCCC
jgi:hypothetical protein